MINVNDTCFPCTAAARDSACAPVQGRTRGVACERRRVAGALPSTNITVTPIQQYRLHQPLLLLRHQSQQPLELSGNVGLTNHASLRRRTQPPPHRPSQTNHEPPRHPPAPSRKRRRNPTPPKVGPPHKWPTRPTTWAHTQHVCVYIYIYIYMVLRISANTLVQAFAHLLSAARSREHGGKGQETRSAKGAGRALVGGAEVEYCFGSGARCDARMSVRAQCDGRGGLVVNGEGQRCRLSVRRRGGCGSGRVGVAGARHVVRLEVNQRVERRSGGGVG